ncbi:MAG: twitching motility protein PilT [Geobacteraceae bacterium GWC2_53_11]|nr:MAG: twitching motility protein PilT [Geobacteraceae bacterium GWC2_53_11]
MYLFWNRPKATDSGRLFLYNLQFTVFFGTLVPSITLYEVFQIVCRQRGEDAALQAVAMMQQGRVIELTSSIALLAAKLSLDVKTPMTDSIVLATAQIHAAVLWTQDNDFEGISGVNYFPKAGA